MAEKRSKQNQTISMEMLDAYRHALYEVKNFYESINFKDYGDDIELKIKVTTAILAAGEKIGKNIESLDRLEEKVKKEEMELSSRRGKATSSMFED